MDDSVADSIDGLVSPQEAAQSLASADPTAVGADTAQESDGVRVRADGDAFAASGNGVDIEIPTDAVRPLEVETQSGTLAVTPLDVSSQASAGTAVNDREAVVFANTGVLSDTSIVPAAERL